MNLAKQRASRRRGEEFGRGWRRMRPLAEAPHNTFSHVRFILTDMDETLTYGGRLAARTYHALERLQHFGFKVIPVTAAPAGWCDQVARMWPVDGVIAENGGLYIERNADGRGVQRIFWNAPSERSSPSPRLLRATREIEARFPQSRGPPINLSDSRRLPLIAQPARSSAPRSLRRLKPRGSARP